MKTRARFLLLGVGLAVLLAFAAGCNPGTVPPPDGPIPTGLPSQIPQPTAEPSDPILPIHTRPPGIPEPSIAIPPPIY